jgi:6-pyruvoyltetrahydropterin/6-carboxytetrahydropterin synthase
MGKKVTICRKAYFNATHRLHNPNWSDEKNREVFGICNNKNYHGHNYELIVKLHGEIDPETGLVYDFKKLKDIIKLHIEDRYDHRNLYEDVADFKDTVPSTENMAVCIWEILREQIDARFDIEVVLYETPRNFVEYSG